MKVSVSTYKNIIFFDYYPDLEDNDVENDVVISNRSCFYELPFNIDENKIHNDLLAFSILLTGYPYIHSELVLDFPVSPFLEKLYWKD